MVKHILRKKDNQPKEEIAREEVASPFGKLIAKKDFVIAFNDYYRAIKTGDDLTDVPDSFHPNLITEGII